MFLPILVKILLVAVVFGLDYDSPSRGEDVLVEVELHWLEEEAAEDGCDSQALPIGEMHDGGIWSHAVSVKPIKSVQDAMRAWARAIGSRYAPLLVLFCLFADAFTIQP